MKTVRFSTWSSLLLIGGFAVGISACGTTNNGAALGTGSMTTWSNDQVLQTYITLNQGEVLTSQSVAGADTVNLGAEADMSNMDTTGMDMDMDMSNMEMSDVDTPEEFARMMVTQHGKAVQEAVALAGDTELGVESNPVSESLRSTAQNMADQLESLSGDQLGSQYMRDQVTLHQNALQMLDNTLIPNTTDPQLLQMLQQGRQIVATHLEIAQRIQADMQNQSTPSPDTDR
ncbi:MAG TPA: DUF4142 domain-containing protein [Rhodothermales bacterium]|nr:DUF4142 domain-containing protein [Rhodothermales bacterium]